MQSDNRPQPFSYYFPAILILLALGGGGLYYTVNYLLPTVGPRWLLYFCLLLLGAGLFMPLTWFINRRFPSNPPAGPNVVIRQALWFGVFAALLAWLQIGRVLTLPLGTILGAALVLIEFLIRMWERSRWSPDQAV
ncbi:MAG: hypothetical protein GX603_06070 [Chloroflexi bacterium]|nr:hypothetical protein [Chloroflexota bacterium]